MHWNSYDCGSFCQFSEYTHHNTVLPLPAELSSINHQNIWVLMTYTSQLIGDQIPHSASISQKSLPQRSSMLYPPGTFQVHYHSCWWIPSQIWTTKKVSSFFHQLDKRWLVSFASCVVMGVKEG